MAGTARYIYDNSAPQSAGLAAGQTVNVLFRLRSLMSANGFDPGGVTSAQSRWGTDSLTYATYDCVNVYTDHARNLNLDEFAQTVNAGPIGHPQGNLQGTHGLICGGTTNNMLQMPIYSMQPDIR